MAIHTLFLDCFAALAITMPPRHREERSDVAIHTFFLDCFAALAMTGKKDWIASLCSQ